MPSPTARQRAVTGGDDIDVVLGLETGADDYVVKPVQARVLDARIRAVLRRQDASLPDGARPRPSSGSEEHQAAEQAPSGPARRRIGGGVRCS